MTTQVIVLRESWKSSIASDAVTLATVIAPIGVGVWLDSAAMQWAGFMLFALSVVGRAARKTADGRMSVDQAIAHLEAIKAKEASA